MQPVVYIVASIKITAQHALIVLPNELLDHFPATRMMVFVITNAGGGKAPDVAIAAIFSPSGFIRLHRWTGTDGDFEAIEDGLCILLDAVQEFCQLPATSSNPCRVRSTSRTWRSGNRITVRK